MKKLVLLFLLEAFAIGALCADIVSNDGYVTVVGNAYKQPSSTNIRLSGFWNAPAEIKVRVDSGIFEGSVNTVYVFYDLNTQNIDTAFRIQGVTPSLVFNTAGTHTVSLAGHTSVVLSYEHFTNSRGAYIPWYGVVLNKDSTAPSFSLSPSPTTSASNWTKLSQLALTVSNFVDPSNGSGLQSAFYSVDGGSDVAVSISQLSNPLSIADLSSGVHTVRFTLLDRLGNAASQSISHFVDFSPPTPVDRPQLSVTSRSTSEPRFDDIVATWTAATDQGSGVERYVVYFDNGDGQWVSVASTSETHFSIPIPFRTASAVSRVAVIAVDFAGNGRSIDDPLVAVSSIAIPQTLRIDSVGVPSIEASTGVRKVPLTLNVTASDLSAFSKLSLQRKSALAPSPLPLSLTQTPIEIDTTSVVDSQGTLLDPLRWSIASDGSQRLVYTDFVPPTPLSAGRSLQYAVSAQIPFSSVWEQGNVSSPVVLPVLPGSVTVQVFDAQGHAYGSPNFKVYSDGLLHLAIQGSSFDRDRWELEVDRVVQVGNTATLTSYSRIGTNSSVGYEFDPALASYPLLTIPIALKAGITNLCVSWKQSDSPVVYRSEIVSLELTADPTGGFTIVVTDRYHQATDGSANTVLTRPGQPLTFSVAGGSPLLDYDWTFGDGSANASGSSVVHSYHQASNPTSSSVTYELTLVVSTIPSTVLALSVVVQNTQAGELYESETWAGDHVVTGVVVVPSGLSLTIASNQTITFQGALGAGYSQGIVVKNGGTLSIADGVILDRDSSQTRRWAGVLIDGGTLTIGESSLFHAERAVAVGVGSNVTLTSTTLSDNVIGLHVVGDKVTSPHVVVRSATIKNNTLNGIKENAAGVPTVIDTKFTGNFENYYSGKGGALSLSEINAIPGNSGNGEQ